MDSAGASITVRIGPDGYAETGDPAADRRLRRRIDAEVEKRFGLAVAEWARRDTGRLTTRRGLREEVSRDFRVLLEALGPWSVVDSGELFPAAAEEDFLSFFDPFD